MKNEKLERLARSLAEKEQTEPIPGGAPDQEPEVELLPDELAEKLAGGQNRGCTCTNSGCNC